MTAMMTPQPSALAAYQLVKQFVVYIHFTPSNLRILGLLSEPGSVYLFKSAFYRSLNPLESDSFLFKP